MNRHVRYALLTPLLVSSVALPPAMAAHASPVDRAPTALCAAPQAACKREVAAGTDPVEFDLVLTGFKPGAQVKVTGPEKFSRTVDNAGSFTEQDVKKGTYTVKVNQGRNHNQLTVNCAKPARVPPPLPSWWPRNGAPGLRSWHDFLPLSNAWPGGWCHRLRRHRQTADYGHDHRLLRRSGGSS